MTVLGPTALTYPGMQGSSEKRETMKAIRDTYVKKQMNASTDLPGSLIKGSLQAFMT